MYRVQDFSFPSSDGLHQIRYKKWTPRQNPVGIIQLVHGISEHIERYDELAGFLADHGYIVIGDDHLGHGKSVQRHELGFTARKNGWKYMVEDERRLFELAHKEYPNLSVFLFGHSMGSFLARNLLIDDPYLYDGSILCGTGTKPALVLKAGKILTRLISTIKGADHRSALLEKLMFGSYLKKIDQPESPVDWLSTDRRVIGRYLDDPLSGNRACAALAHDLMSGLEIVKDRKNLEKMNKEMPVLFIAGLDDPVGDYGKGIRKVVSDFEKAGMKQVKTILYPGMRHEIHNEPGRQKVFYDVLGWLKQHNKKPSII